MTRHDPARDGPLEQVDGGVLLHVLAFPKAKHNEIAGVRNGRLMVKVTAAPEDGKANEAIVKLLAGHLSLTRNDIVVKSGVTSREKTIVLLDADPAAIKAALNL